MNARVYIWPFIFFFLATACSRQKVPDNVILIAHAGGVVEGKNHTNSLEAVQQAMADGFSHIELDLLFTRDSVLVAARSWSEFNRMTGFPEQGDSAPTLEDFCHRKLYGNYTPLTAQDILALFDSIPDLYLVTDKISTPEILLHYFAPIKHRMLVEAFSYADYVALKKAGFYLPMYSCMAHDVYSALTDHLLFYWWNNGTERIDKIVIDSSVYTYLFYKILYRFCNFDVALFTVNDWDAIPSGYRNNIKFIYTDRLKP